MNTASAQHDPARRTARICSRRSAGALPGPGQVRSRATDRLALGHDASHFALTPSAVATPRNADGGRAAVRRLGRAAGAADLSVRGHQPERSGRHRRDPGGHPPALPGHRDPGRRRQGPGGPGRDRPSGERPAGRLRAQAGPRPGERDRLHPGRCRRQQLQRDGVRNGREHLQHARVAGPGAAQRVGDRHRRRRRRRPAARAGTGAVRGPGPAARPGAGQSRSRCGPSSSSSR